MKPSDPVEVLVEEGILGESDVKKLKSVGIVTVAQLASMMVDEVEAVFKGGRDKAEALLKRLWRELGYLEPKPAIIVKREMAGRPRITTGSKALDALLGGGVETGIVTEFFGEYGSGKTQLCHQLAVNVQLPPGKGGLGKRAVYIDTEGTFRWERIEAMAKRWGLDPDKVMDNIYYVRAINSDHQMAIVEQLLEEAPKLNIGLVIVDSVTSHFRAEYVGRDKLPERQQKLNRHLHQLARLAEFYGIAVVVTNQVYESPEYYKAGPQAVGGHVLYHAPGVRVMLIKSRSSGNVRIAKVVDAPHIPESSARFRITNRGIEDV